MAWRGRTYCHGRVSNRPACRHPNRTHRVKPMRASMQAVQAAREAWKSRGTVARHGIASVDRHTEGHDGAEVAASPSAHSTKWQRANVCWRVPAMGQHTHYVQIKLHPRRAESNSCGVKKAQEHLLKSAYMRDERGMPSLLVVVQLARKCCCGRGLIEKHPSQCANNATAHTKKRRNEDTANACKGHG